MHINNETSCSLMFLSLEKVPICSVWASGFLTFKNFTFFYPTCRWKRQPKHSKVRWFHYQRKKKFRTIFKKSIFIQLPTLNSNNRVLHTEIAENLTRVTQRESAFSCLSTVTFINYTRLKIDLTFRHYRYHALFLPDPSMSLHF